MKVFRIIYCLCTFLFIAAQNIFGCSPYGYPNAPLIYKVAKTEKIYIGKVISKSSTIKSRDDYSYRQIRVKFQIVKALKGINNEIQEIILEEPLKNIEPHVIADRRIL